MVPSTQLDSVYFNGSQLDFPKREGEQGVFWQLPIDKHIFNLTPELEQ